MARNLKWRIAGLAAIVACMAALLAFVNSGKETKREEVLAVRDDRRAEAPPDGERVNPGSGFLAVASNGRLSLEVNALGQIRVVDADSKAEWRSNPDPAVLGEEQAQGFWRKNLESPFILEYLDLAKGSTSVEQAGAKELQADVSVYRTDGGAEIRFELRSIQLQFSYLVKLADGYVEVSVPQERIREEADKKLVSLWVLPFFGAERSGEEDGYLFVPDGIGAIIPFDTPGSRPFRFSTRLYGDDMSAVGQSPARLSRYNQDIAADALYPVFGAAAGGKAFVGIIDEGDYTANIHATPAGLYTSFNWVAPQFIYRSGYFKRTSKFGKGFTMYETDRTEEDRRIRYYLLEGDEANYAGMAKTYRKYLMEARGLQRTNADYALDLYVFGGDREPSLFGTSFVAATTFGQAGDMVRGLSELGVDRLDVTFMGWENKGYMLGTPGRFPPNRTLGGADGLKRLAEDVHGLGGRLYLSDSFTVALSGAGGFNPRYDAVRDLNGKVIEDALPLKGVNKYWLHPDVSLQNLNEAMETFRGFGIDGLYQSGVGETIFADRTPAHPSSRQRTAAYYGRMLQATKTALGSARVSHGNAYVLPYASHIGSLPFDTSYDLLARVSVPFYPIALHGLVAYSGIPGNLQDTGISAWLKAVEYGAVPAYLLTYEDPAVLTDTLSRWIYNGQFQQWERPVAEQYAKLKRDVGELADRFIEDHRALASGVYETTYEDGTRVIVNYNSTVYAEGGIAVSPESYAVLRKGEQP